MSDCPMLISNKLHSFRNFNYTNIRHSWNTIRESHCFLRMKSKKIATFADYVLSVFLSVEAR